MALSGPFYSPSSPLPSAPVRAQSDQADRLHEAAKAFLGLDNDVRHVGVLSPRGELLGVLGGIDLVAAEARTPFALRREIGRARDKEELREAAQLLRSTVC